MLILACVDAWTTCTKHQIQICKQSKEVVGEDFINSKEAIATESLQLSESDHMMNEYKMETRLWKLDLASRGLEIKSTALEEEGQQYYVQQVDAKGIVNWMVEDVELAVSKR